MYRTGQTLNIIPQVHWDLRCWSCSRVSMSLTRVVECLFHAFRVPALLENLAIPALCFSQF